MPIISLFISRKRKPCIAVVNVELGKLLTYCVLNTRANLASYPQRDRKWVVAYTIVGYGVKAQCG